MAELLESTTDPRWSPVLAGVRSEALDCLQTVFAALADEAHGPSAHLALGARWQLRREQAPLAARLEQAGELLGLRANSRWAGTHGPRMRELAEAAGLAVVAADAWTLPWLPYAGRQHMEHGFLLLASEGRFTVADPYHNDTPWGPARPGCWEVRPRLLDEIGSAGVTVLTMESGPSPRLDVPAILASNSDRMQAALRAERTGEDGMSLHAPAGIAGLERFVLEIWLGCRERALHAAWLASLAEPPAASAEMAGHVQRWRELAAHSYMTLRRADRGQLAATELVSELGRLHEHDAAIAGRLACDAVRDDPPAPVSRAVLGALCGVLGVDERTILRSASLFDLPGFNSFRLVEAIAEAEDLLGVRLAAERISPSDIGGYAGLCALFAHAGEPA
jgi:hypothetical protein